MSTSFYSLLYYVYIYSVKPEQLSYTRDWSCNSSLHGSIYFVILGIGQTGESPRGLILEINIHKTKQTFSGSSIIVCVDSSKEWILCQMLTTLTRENSLHAPKQIQLLSLTDEVFLWASSFSHIYIHTENNKKYVTKITEIFWICCTGQSWSCFLKMQISSGVVRQHPPVCTRNKEICSLHSSPRLYTHPHTVFNKLDHNLGKFHVQSSMCTKFWRKNIFVGFKCTKCSL